MTWDWQQVVALMCVAAAVFVLGRRAHRWWKTSAAGGCASGCHSCSEKNPSAPVHKPLVTLELNDRARLSDEPGG
jgi:hypothetical protein